MPGRALALSALSLAATGLLGLTGCTATGDPLASAARAGTAYSPADEATYLARYEALARSGSVGAGEAAYGPLDSVQGHPNPAPLPTRSVPTFSSGTLAAARSYAGTRNSSALIIWRDGAIEEETYFGDFDRHSPIISKSLAKPITALVVGRAIMQGHIESLDQPVADFITEWQHDDRRSRITIRQLLGMRSGLLPQALAGGPEDVLYRAYLHPRHDEIIINDYPVVDEPGSAYEYSNANAELIAPIIERATGVTYADYVSQALLAPIGAAGGSVWVNREGGTAHSGCCMMLQAQSYLRMAILLLDDGVWEGTRLLPRGYVAQMREPAPQNPHYGLGVWLAGPYVERRGYANPRVDEGKVLHSEPYLDSDIFLFDGNSNQVVYVIPSQRTILLRTGGRPPQQREWDNAFLPNLLIRDAISAPGAKMPDPQPR